MICSMITVYNIISIIVFYKQDECLKKNQSTPRPSVPAAVAFRVYCTTNMIPFTFVFVFVFVIVFLWI